MMMKRFLLFVTVIGCLGLIFAITAIGEGQPAKIALHEEQKICGTTLVANANDFILENTRRLHPQLPVTLAKSGQRQVDVGDTLSFYTINYKTYSYETIKAVCRYQSDRARIFVGLQAIEEGKVTQADVDNFYYAFEIATPAQSIDPSKGIIQIMNQYIGQAPNLFDDPYVYILIYDIIDNYDPNAGSYQYIAGYFNPSDLTSGSYSNKKNLIHVDCNPLRPDREDALATVAHEFQHLIHQGYDPDENTTGLWVNEGASEYCEVLCGFPLRNPAGYLLNPDRSLTAFDNNYKELLDYKKVALWTYYLAEKFGPELIGEIVRHPANSVDGVRAALLNRGISLSFEDIFSNFVIANYADDASLDSGGYYSYNKLILPAVPPATVHRFYPVSDQIKTVSPYAAFYARFTAKDSTAILRVTNQLSDQFRHRMLLKGAAAKLEDISLDAFKKGSYSLRAIGVDADEAVMAGISLGTVSVCTYGVTSEFKDIAPPMILSGPTEFLPTGNSITIIWQTDEPANSIVEYGLTPSYDKQVIDGNFTTQHSITLTGLTANSHYHYRVGSADGLGNGPRYSADFTFTTSSMNAGTVVTVQQAHAYGYLGRNLVRSKDGMLHLIYHEIVGERRFIYHKNSADNGATWSDAHPIDQILYYGGMPAVAIDSLDRLHIAWHAKEFSESKYGIFYSRSDDGGLSWTLPKQVSRTTASNDELYAAIAVDKNNNPHVVWNSALYQDQNTGDVYYAYSNDGGTSWTAARMISQSVAHRCFVPTIDITSIGKAYVLWVDGIFEQQSRKVWGASSSDYVNWSMPTALTQSGVLYDLFVSFVVDDKDRLHMVYSDNYTPGDIRVMYSYADADVWSPPVPVARSLLGNVDSPNIACDRTGALYLAYRDDMGSSTLNKGGGYLSRPFTDIEQVGLAKEMVAQKGEIFFSVCRDGVWSPASNISNDDDDNRYPELPRRMMPAGADVIWMREIGAAAYQLRHLHINTASPAYTTPLQISAVYPAADAVDVPYFKHAFAVRVDFNQRVAVDSLIPAHVIITSTTSGIIDGKIIYDTADRRMTFTANAALTPNDLITVTLRGTITNESGIGLDGDGDGIAEGSPTDDYSWSFRTQPSDVVAPTFTIGVLQNPVLTHYMDIYAISSEMLATTPKITIAGQEAKTALLPGEGMIYKTDYRLQQSGVITIRVDGVDLAGNAGTASRDFSAQLLLAESGGDILAPDQGMKLIVPSGALLHDEYLTIIKHVQPVIETSPGAHYDSYQIGPTSCRLAKAAQICFALKEKEDHPYVIEQQQPDGSWREITTICQASQVMALTTSLGNFRLRSAAPTLPQNYVLRQNYPNPFRLRAEQTTVVFELPQQQRVEVVIYDLLGRQVRTLLNGTKPAGVHSVVWDGREDSGGWAASGIYFYQFQAGVQKITRKMLLLQ